ncbi:MFS transporter [Pseudalkalibacillus caeni]|uniref:MFS transporter n=1 Tax=Exobacillus caeni TaxID=2574798 RepID=UPI001484FA4D|nr:MFS transporter [Pseudalkalibacillus caeni]
MKLSLSIFKNRNFLFYWLAGWITSIGDSIFLIALTWMLVEQTKSPLVVGTYLSVVGITKLIFILFGGIVVDRFDVRRLLIYSDWIRAVLMLVFVVMGLNGMPPLWFFYVIGLLFGAIDAVAEPAGIACRTRIIEKEYYTQSMSLLLITGNVSTVVGPMIAAGIVYLGGSMTAVFANGVSYVLSAILLLSVNFKPVGEEVETDGKRPLEVLKGLREGFSFFFRTPVILAMATSAFFANAAVGITVLATPFLVKDLHLGVAGYGMLNTSIGIGGIVGAALFSLFVISRPTPGMALSTSICQGSFIVLVGITDQLWIIVFAFLLIGFNEAAVNVIAPSVNHTLIPQKIFGRVISVLILIMGASEPIFQAFGGWLMEAVTAQKMFMIGGFIEVSAAAIIFFMPAVRTYKEKMAKAS